MKKVKLKENLIYRDFIISINNEYLTIGDKNGFLCKKIQNLNHGGLTDCKYYIDRFIMERKV